MSGIAGIFARRDGEVSGELMAAMTGFMAYRGPDARETWRGDRCAFGHAMLRTTHESFHERQPANLDGLWITADARLDCRSALKAEIEATGRCVPFGAADCDLLLLAYAAWGENSVRHLRGDFAFAIWDSGRHVLFCARDHFGIKPFYYAECGDRFVFSNTLACVRLHPDVSDELNEAAIGDFLLFGLNWNPATTAWRDVQRLPAAHYLLASAEGIRVERYWSAPVDACVRYRRPEDYVEHFRELLQEAVAERLSPDCTGIFLSGGMDSSSLAAMARKICDERGGSMNLRAYTVVSRSVADSDTPCARQVAEHLRIPSCCIDLDDLAPFEGWEDPEQQFLEPIEDPLAAGLFPQFRAVAQDCRAVFDGEGSDNLMHFQSMPYARYLWSAREWRRLSTETAEYLWVRPFPWRGIRQRLTNIVRGNGGVAVPRWIAPEFARRTKLEQRCREAGALRMPRRGHPCLPKAHASLELPQWSQMFEMADPGVTRTPVETRYPFLDLRVVSYLLSLPPFPWAFQKKILRDAMAGRLPEAIVRRPKTPLSDDPSAAALRGKERSWIARHGWSGAIAHFVDRDKLESAVGDVKKTDGVHRALCLKFWLRTLQPARTPDLAEV